MTRPYILTRSAAADLHERMDIFALLQERLD